MFKLNRLPLWLDEVLQLLETRNTSAAEMLTVLPRNPGAAPLGYLVQQATLRIGGYSVRRARLPMAVFGAASVFLVALLAAELGVRRAWLAATLFAVFPLTFRYATESRVYSQALFLSVLATLLYARAAKRPTWALALLYSLVLTAAIYTQPFAGSVGMAHVLWSLTQREKSGTWLLGVSALAASVLLFLPWYFWSKDKWAAGLGPNTIHFSATVNTPLLLFREIAGAGYWGSGLLLIVCAIALTSRLPSPRTHLLLVLLIAAPLLGVLAADFIFNYFIAARQFIWVLPAVAILAASAADKYPCAGLTLAALFCAVGVMQSVKYFTAPHENIQLAARAMASEAMQGACVTTVAPKEFSRLYEFFEPQVSRDLCDSPRVVLAVPPYSTAARRTAAIVNLTSHGYKQEREALVGGSTLIFFHR
jgi:4-amino-4-deoxy-L-arabinose transferase-like glycosyltransferase